MSWLPLSSCFQSTTWNGAWPNHSTFSTLNIVFSGWAGVIINLPVKLYKKPKINQINSNLLWTEAAIISFRVFLLFESFRLLVGLFKNSRFTLGVAHPYYIQAAENVMVTKLWAESEQRKLNLNMIINQK